MPDLHAILSSARTIAVIGLSGSRFQTSHRVARYLQQAGYRIIPVNPNYEDVLGEPCYPDMPSIPHDIRIDLVDIFRQPQHTADMVRTVIERVRETGEQPVIWTQLGVSSPEAERLARNASLVYVANACTMAEHMRM